MTGGLSVKGSYKYMFITQAMIAIHYMYRFIFHTILLQIRNLMYLFSCHFNPFVSRFVVCLADATGDFKGLSLKPVLCPQRNFGGHIEIALSVCQSVCSVLCPVHISYIL